METTILYIDDEISNLTNFKFVFRKHYNIHLAETVEEGFEIIRNTEIHLRKLSLSGNGGFNSSPPSSPGLPSLTSSLICINKIGGKL